MEKRFIFLFLVLLTACVAPQNTQKNTRTDLPSQNATPKPDRQVIEKSSPSKPDWVDRESFTSQEKPGYRFFKGFYFGTSDLEDARQSALADARRAAAAYVETYVQSEFEQQISSRIRGNKETYKEMVRSEVRTKTDTLLEGAVTSDQPWWLRYNDGNIECYVLLAVPEKNLNPRHLLIRNLRKAALGCDEEDRIDFMDAILTYLPGDLLAHYTKARSLQALGRAGDALTVLEALRDLNKKPELNLHLLAAAAEIPVPEGYPPDIDLDKLIFDLTPHWDRTLQQLYNWAKDHENPSAFKVEISKHNFFASDYPETDPQGLPPRPVSLTFIYPDELMKEFVLFWIDEEGIFQINQNAPQADAMPSSNGLNLTLGTYNGRVDLLLLASDTSNLLNIGEAGLALEDGILKNKIMNLKDRQEINRFQGLLRILEQRADGSDNLFAARTWFTQNP